MFLPVFQHFFLISAYCFRKRKQFDLKVELVAKTTNKCFHRKIFLEILFEGLRTSIRPHNAHSSEHPPHYSPSPSRALVPTTQFGYIHRVNTFLFVPNCSSIISANWFHIAANRVSLENSFHTLNGNSTNSSEGFRWQPLSMDTFLV